MLYCNHGYYQQAQATPAGTNSRAVGDGRHDGIGTSIDIEMKVSLGDSNGGVMTRLWVQNQPAEKGYALANSLSETCLYLVLAVDARIAQSLNDRRTARRNTFQKWGNDWKADFWKGPALRFSIRDDAGEHLVLSATTCIVNDASSPVELNNTVSAYVDVSKAPLALSFVP